MRLVFICISYLLVVQTVWAVQSASGTPTRAIQNLDSKLDSYRSGPNLTSADEEYNKELKKDVLRGTFDIRELCKISLGKNWNDRSQQEQDDFVQLMTDLLENLAIFSREQGRKKAKSKNLYSVTYKGDKYLDAEKGRSLTRTSVYVKSEDIHVTLDYKLKKVGDEWKIYDVIVDGASLGDNYKYQFDSIIRKNGYPDLVKRMQSKLAGLKNKKS